MLDEDVCNNSAWSFRYFLIMKGNKFDKELVASEIDYVMKKRLPQNYFNESAWVYLRGMLALTQEEAEASLKTHVKKIAIMTFPQLK
mmetsp:Transcript_510/g.561  ORF Transcript_510/g.561 Transcript_510/m.561 type:complete len:87 (+) Transcript_510:530-790(+)